MCGCQGSNQVWQGGGAAAAQGQVGAARGVPAVRADGTRIMPHARRTGPTFHTVQDQPRKR